MSTHAFIALSVSIAWTSGFTAELAATTTLEWYELLLAFVMMALTGFVLVYLWGKVVLR